VTGLEVVVAHSVTDAPALPIGPAASYAVTPSRLEALLEPRERWCRTPYPACLESPSAAEPKRLLTFDDGYRDFATRALPLLEASETPCLLFVVTRWADGSEGPLENRLAALVAALDRIRLPSGEDRMLPTREARDRTYRELYLAARGDPPAGRRARLEALARDNDVPIPPVPEPFLDWDAIAALDRHPLVTIGAHSRTHPLLTTIPLVEARHEIAASRRDLAERLGHPVDAFSYPYGGHSFRLRRATRDAGYRHAFTTRARPVGRRLRPFAIPRIDIHHPRLASHG
jgi:peptidoglycan/xylan/chitin deacetylase (PgdA/CDA1 family)